MLGRPARRFTKLHNPFSIFVHLFEQCLSRHSVFLLSRRIGRLCEPNARKGKAPDPARRRVYTPVRRYIHSEHALAFYCFRDIIWAVLSGRVLMIDVGSVISVALFAVFVTDVGPRSWDPAYGVANQLFEVVFDCPRLGVNWSQRLVSRRSPSTTPRPWVWRLNEVDVHAHILDYVDTWLRAQDQLHSSLHASPGR